MRFVVLAIVLFVLLSGCASPRDGAAPASEPAPAPESHPGEQSPDPAASPPRDPASPERVQFAFEGDVGHGACVPTGPSTCRYIAEDYDGRFIVPYQGLARDIVVEVAWVADSPATESMRAVFAFAHRCGDDRQSWCWEVEDTVWADGESPLTLRLWEAHVTVERALVLDVFAPARETGPVTGAAFTEQAFNASITLLDHGVVPITDSAGAARLVS